MGVGLFMHSPANILQRTSADTSNVSPNMVSHWCVQPAAEHELITPTTLEL